MFLSNVIHKDF